MNQQEALDVVFYAIDVVNGQRTDNEQIAKRADVTLVGDGGVLDSLGFVTLVLAMERRISELSGTEVELFGDDGFDAHEFGAGTAASFSHVIRARIPG